MATFGISVTEAQKEQFEKALATLATEGEKKADTLSRICSHALDTMEQQRLKDSGVDVKGLDLALSTIKILFGAQVAAREQVEAATMDRVRAETAKSQATIDALGDQLRAAKNDIEDLHGQIAALKAECARKDKDVDAYRHIADLTTDVIRNMAEAAALKAAPVLQARISSLEALLREHGIDVPDAGYIYDIVSSDADKL